MKNIYALLLSLLLFSSCGAISELAIEEYQLQSTYSQNKKYIDSNAQKISIVNDESIRDAETNELKSKFELIKEAHIIIKSSTNTNRFENIKNYILENELKGQRGFLNDRQNVKLKYEVVMPFNDSKIINRLGANQLGEASYHSLNIHFLIEINFNENEIFINADNIMLTGMYNTASSHSTKIGNITTKRTTYYKNYFEKKGFFFRGYNINSYYALIVNEMIIKKIAQIVKNII